MDGLLCPPVGIRLSGWSKPGATVDDGPSASRASTRSHNAPHKIAPAPRLRKALTRASRLHQLTKLSSRRIAPTSLQSHRTWSLSTLVTGTLFRAMTDETCDPALDGVTATQKPPMSVEQAAAYLGRNVRFVRRLIAERRIAFYKMDRRVQISPAELDRYMRSCLTPVGGTKGMRRDNG